MEKTTYLKIIFEKGSLIFRHITSYNMDSVNQLMIVTFKDKTACAIDMIHMCSCLGRMKNTKSNLHDNHERQLVDISDELQ